VRKILMFGYRPPPVFGPSVAYENLLRSEFVRHFDVQFINLSVVKKIRELEGFRPGKVLKLGRFVLQELWYLVVKRPALCVYPVAYNRQALWKDSLLMGLARAFRVPVVVWAHGMGAPRFRESLAPRWRRWFDRNIQNAAGIVVLADCLRAEFLDWVPAQRVHTVNIGIEPVADLPPRVSVPNRLTVLYLGALSRTKGVFDLLQAMTLVCQRVPQVRLVMAGEWFRADEEAEARRLVQERGLTGVVEWPGPVQGTAKWRLFRTADVFVFPPYSQFEAYGIVLLEAMQAGLPIVATRGGARNEIISDGVNGLLADEKNPADLAEKISRLAGDTALRTKMGQANRVTFNRRYTHELFGQRMIAVFEELAHV
jgi:glycosyltransferase involved in cell wall biosynthesis